MNNKIIIISTIGFLLISFVFLSYVEQKKQDINSQNWWAVYFEDPKSASLNFTIENHSDGDDFHWEILTDKTKTKEGDIAIKKGELKIMPVSTIGIENKKITVVITDKKNNKKRIYKQL